MTITLIGFTGASADALRFIYDRTRRIWPTAVAVTDDSLSGRDVHGSALSCFAGVDRFTLYPDNPDAVDIQTFELPETGGVIVLPDFDPKPHVKSSVTVSVDGHEISLIPNGISAVELVARLAALPVWSHRARQEVIDFHPTPDTRVNGDFSWDALSGYQVHIDGNTTKLFPETPMPQDVAVPAYPFTGDASANLYCPNTPETPIPSDAVTPAISFTEDTSGFNPYVLAEAPVPGENAEIIDSIIFRADYLGNRLDLRAEGMRYNNGPLLKAEDAHKAYLDIMTQIADAPDAPSAQADALPLMPGDTIMTCGATDSEVISGVPGPQEMLRITPTSFVYQGFIIEDGGAAARVTARVLRIPHA